MIARANGGPGRRPLVVVHGHREGNAVGGQRWISDECVARVRAAERAARRFRSELVLFCGAGALGGPSEARQMESIWESPTVRTFLDEHSTDTAENAREAREWFDRLSASGLVVVSSWWHVRLRAYYAGSAFAGIAVRHVVTRRCDRVVARLAHELRYAPRAFRLRDAATG
jgi:uncharacterized SAM-binding protein YcdF (DUF218 family)